MKTKQTLSPPQCVHCHASAYEVRYHSRYQTLDGERIVFRCRVCLKTFNDRYGTAFYDLKKPSKQVTRAVQQVAEGLSFEAVARVENISPKTVSEWTKRASKQADLIDTELVCGLTVEVVEVDELYSFAGNKQEVETRQSETGKHWTHCSFARTTRLILEVEVGERNEVLAQSLIAKTACRLSKDCYPLWVSDGWKAYIFALLLKYQRLVQQIKRTGRGRPPKPKMIPPPSLRYAQVVKQTERGRVVGIEKRIIFDEEQLIDYKEVITSHIERLNGTMRLHVTPLHRKTRCFAKKKSKLQEQVTLFKSYYNFCLPHHSLDYQTPAQATGIIDKRLTMRELLNYGGS
jgi:transposase-like protein/IS1 family transposase